MDEPSAATPIVLVHGEVDLSRRVARLRDVVHRLTTNEAALLARLAETPNVPVSREDLLREVWGYSADAVTRTVDVTVRRLRAKIEPDPTLPVHLLSVHGVGYVFVPHQPGAPAESALGPEPVSEPAPPPPRHPDTIGRDADLAAARAAFVSGARPLVLVGPAGVGKTHLARALLAEARAAGEETWFVDLVGATSGEDLAVATATALGLDRAAEAAIVRHLRGVTGLLVLDNFEQLPIEATAQLGRWLDAGPGVRVMVTSRRPLGLPAEELLRLAPLSTTDAAALFRRRALRVRADVELPDDTVLRHLAERLDGLPLALELAAGRLRALSVADLVERLDLALLRDPTGSRPGRATLSLALDASWTLLDPSAQRALVALSALPGPCAVPVALALLQAAGVAEPLEALETLADHSLLRVEEGPVGTATTWLLPFVCVREYAANRRDAGAPEPPWILALATSASRWQAELGGPDRRRARLRLLSHADLVSAAVVSPGEFTGQALIAAQAFLEACRQAGGHPADLRVLDAAITLASDDLDLRAQLLSQRAAVNDRIGRFEAACADANAVDALGGDSLPRRCARLRAGVRRASALRRGGHTVEALAAVEALDLAPDTPADEASLVENERGLALLLLGRLEDAADAFERAQGVAERGGNLARADAALSHLAIVRVEEGRAAEIVPRVRAALERAQEDDAPGATLTWLYALGMGALEAGDTREARACFERMMEAARRTGRATSIASTWINLGHVALVEGDPAGAVRAYSSAGAAFREIRRDSPVVVSVGSTLARIGARLPADTSAEAAATDRPTDAALLALGAAAGAWARGESGAEGRLRAAADAARGAKNADLRVLGGYAALLLRGRTTR